MPAKFPRSMPQSADELVMTVFGMVTAGHKRDAERMRSLYAAFRSEGFDDAQAFELVKVYLAGILARG